MRLSEGENYVISERDGLVVRIQLVLLAGRPAETGGIVISIGLAELQRAAVETDGARGA